MNLTIIAAVSENNVIGRNGDIPWNLPKDMKRFSKLTSNHPIIMGRKTYKSIGRPLPKRKNIILSKRSTFKNKDLYIARNIEQALSLAEGQDTYIIGGNKVYEAFLPEANKMEITRVHRYCLCGDLTFFPEVNWDEWKEINKEPSNGCSFITYERK